MSIPKLFCTLNIIYISKYNYVYITMVNIVLCANSLVLNIEVMHMEKLCIASFLHKLTHMRKLNRNMVILTNPSAQPIFEKLCH